MKIRVSKNVEILNADADIRSWCRYNLYVDNPEFYKKQAMGKWTGGLVPRINLYEVKGDTLYCPFGTMRDIWSKTKDKAEWFVSFPKKANLKYNSSIKLYDYQEKVVNEALKVKNGIIVMPCGSGKTQTALEIVNRVGGRCLWLTHTQDLLNQSMNRAKAVFNLSNSAYGRITAGKVEVSKYITFATVQTASKVDLSKYKDYFNLIIVDECHKAVGAPTKIMQFYKVLNSLSARYKIGLTATPTRADGLEKSMYALLGGKIAEVSNKEVKHNTCDFAYTFLETNYQPKYDAILEADGTLNYNNLVSNLIEDKERFSQVLKVIEDLKGATLVLANRVKYLETLNDKYSKKSICLSSLGNSKKAKEIRKKALQDLNSGNLDCIFATYQLAKEGLDIPNLRNLVLATPEKDKTTITQAVGRVRRKYKGKEIGKVYDFIDNFAMYRGWAKKRQRIYERLLKK